VSPILELLVGGFFSAIGWWGANHYVVDKYLEPKPAIEKKVEEKKDEKTSDTDDTPASSLRRP
jgi:hypothetical protein